MRLEYKAYLAEQEEQDIAPAEEIEVELAEPPSTFVHLTQRFLIVMLLTSSLIIMAACIHAISRELPVFLAKGAATTAQAQPGASS